MKNIKVSVIVPVYNAGEYLEKNLLILCRQTLEEIEFILINDASTDNSLDIMTAFKVAFPEKFVVINSQKNRGPGGARNIGIPYAKGEYIGFVDCDDFANPKMFELLYNKAKEKNSDMVMCAYRNSRLNDDLFIDTELFENGLTIEARKKLITFTGFLWHSIFKRDILLGMDMLFRENCIYEDTDFLLDIYLRIKNIDFVCKALYIYVDNKTSLTNKTMSLNDYYKEIECFAKAAVSRCGRSIYYKDVKEAVEFIIIKLGYVYLKINDIQTIENIRAFNLFVKKYVPEYMTNKYLSKEFIKFLELCDDDEKFYKNLKHSNL